MAMTYVCRLAVINLAMFDKFADLKPLVKFFRFTVQLTWICEDSRCSLAKDIKRNNTDSIAVSRGKLGPIHSECAVVGGVTVNSIKLKAGSSSC